MINTTHKWIATILGLLVSAGFVGQPSAFATIITGETATSTTTPWFANDPIDAVNNNGITINYPDLATDGAITHNAATDGDGWARDAFSAGSSAGMTFTVDFGAVSGRTIIGMRVWNYNGFGGTDLGLEQYDLHTSPDGVNWTLRQNNQGLAEAPHNLSGIATNNAFAGVYFGGLAWDDVRYVRYTIDLTYRAQDSGGGLSEVMFLAIPEPSTALLFGLGGGLLWWRKKNRA